MTFHIPAVGDYVQDRLGHWYQVLEVQAQGYRFKVSAVYVSHNSETGATRFNRCDSRPFVVGRSDLRIEEEA